MESRASRCGAALVVIAFWLGACSPNLLQSESPKAPKHELKFVDLQAFDRDLANSLSAPLPKVDVTFYDRIVPSALPERLQPWIASVESGGGTVTVVPPKSSVTAKSPFLVLGAISSLWSATKVARELSAKAQFNAAHAFDAEIILRQDDKGETVVDKVAFIQRKK